MYGSVRVCVYQLMLGGGEATQDGYVTVCVGVELVPLGPQHSKLQGKYLRLKI